MVNEKETFLEGGQSFAVEPHSSTLGATPLPGIQGCGQRLSCRLFATMLLKIAKRLEAAKM